MSNDLIGNLKIAIIYGKKDVDGVNQDGKIEKIYKDEDDTAHFFYIKEFLETHFKDEKDVNEALQIRHDVNSIFYEIQKLGHIVFAEGTFNPEYKEGLFYIPKDISNKQKHTLELFQKQLEEENYSITALFNLHRRKNDGVLLGNQKIGNAEVLDEFMKDEKSLEL